MNIFKNIKNYFLVKKKKGEANQITSGHDLVIEAIKEQPELYYESDELLFITDNSFLDTTTPEAIAKYKANLKLLVEETKRTKQVTGFKLIRDDDFFPYGWKWRVASRNTGIEKGGSYLTYKLREAIATESISHTKGKNIKIPSSWNALMSAMEKIDSNIGLFYNSMKFRSTKHFTVNTPLSYTGEYNNVESNRNFTIIDDIDSFLDSGYAYSADYRDAYLDVTHEGLDISQRAIVLISEDNYQNIMANPIIARELHERNVIVYRGDEALAVNIILTEYGILPARPGNKYMVYDSEIREILEKNMQALCEAYDIEYAKGHGNINGSGGHFSDLYDGYNRNDVASEDRFISFLKEKFPEHADFIFPNILHNPTWAENFVEAVGVTPLLAAIEEYNKIAENEFLGRFNNYNDDRKTITPEISNTFKCTVQAIRRYHLNDNMTQVSEENRAKLRNLFCVFYHAETVQEQLLAAYEICSILNVSLDINLMTENDYRK